MSLLAHWTRTIVREYSFFIMTAPDSAAPGITAQLTQNVPGAISMETETVAQVFKDILDRIAVFPTVLSIMALFAGAVIIANSVALATMERRREIAMMKAVGGQGLPGPHRSPDRKRYHRAGGRGHWSVVIPHYSGGL